MKTEETRVLVPRRSSARLVTGILGASGLIMLVLGIRLLTPALQSTSWLAVPGVITGHQIESTYQQKSVTYRVGVTYTFEAGQRRVSGHAFSHSSAALPMSFMSREAAASAYESAPEFQEWQLGRTVTVYYDPVQPEKAVLKKGAFRLALAVILLGAYLAFAAGWEWCRLRRLAAIS